MTTEVLKKLFSPPGKVDFPIIVACSGGPDSMALLHYATQFYGNNKVICANFNHRWKDSSIEATKLAETLCRELKVLFVAGQAPKAGQNSEAQAREQRYDFLLKVANRLQSRTIFTAHHLDDQIETFVLRLLRGSGPVGLECIQSERFLEGKIKLCRPLLKLNKSDLLNYCAEQNLAFFEDPSNQSLEIKRNKVRAQITPLLAEIEPTYKKQISNFIQILSGQNQLLEAEFKKLKRENFKSCKAFLQQPISLQRLIIKQLLEQKNVSCNFELIESLCKSLREKNKVKISLADNLFFESNTVHFQVVKRALRKESDTFTEIIFDYNNDQSIVIANFGELKITQCRFPIAEIGKVKNSLKVFVDLSKLKNTKLVLRKRKAMDRFQPLNSTYSTKLKSFLINRKVRLQLSAEDNDKLLLLAAESSSDILWIPGVELSDSIKVTDHSTHCFELMAQVTKLERESTTDSEAE